MPTFFLIRHGETEYVKKGLLSGRMPGIHLNEVGLRQANELAAALGSAPIAAIYSSPLERAIETAELIARARGLEVQPAPSLLETNIGEWEGAKAKELRRLPEWKQVQRAPSRFRFPGGESFIEQQARLVAEIERIGLLHTRNENIALVFHADPIKLVIAHYLGMPLDSFQRLGCSTGSLSVLHLEESNVMVLQMNIRPPFPIFTPAQGKGTKKSR